MAKEQIKAIKEKYGYTDELKWTHIHEKTYVMYNENCHAKGQQFDVKDMRNL